MTHSHNLTVPVVAIFTKFDGLLTLAFQKFKRENGGREPTEEEEDSTARLMLDANLGNYLRNESLFPPASYVTLMDLHEAGDCMDLMDKTADALSEDALKILFVSVQQNNIDLCSRYALERCMDRRIDDLACSSHLCLLMRNTLT